MTYTPGPWIRIGRSIYQVASVGGREVVHGSGIKGRESKEEAEANTRLMAAAPELLEVCSKAAVRMEFGQDTNNVTYEMLVAVIAKAQEDSPCSA